MYSRAQVRLCTDRLILCPYEYKFFRAHTVAYVSLTHLTAVRLRVSPFMRSPTPWTRPQLAARRLAAQRLAALSLAAETSVAQSLADWLVAAQSLHAGCSVPCLLGRWLIGARLIRDALICRSCRFSTSHPFSRCLHRVFWPRPWFLLSDISRLSCSSAAGKSWPCILCTCLGAQCGRPLTGRPMWSTRAEHGLKAYLKHLGTIIGSSLIIYHSPLPHTYALSSFTGMANMCITRVEVQHMANSI